MARLRFRIYLDPSGMIGPGKIRLLELIDAEGSISAAARAMGMSYRQAWLLVDVMNKCFQEPLVGARSGGRKGGGATLTLSGKEVVRSYRSIEAGAQRQFADQLRKLQEATARPSKPRRSAIRRAGSSPKPA